MMHGDVVVAVSDIDGGAVAMALHAVALLGHGKGEREAEQGE